MYSRAGVSRQAETITAVVVTALVFTVPALLAGLEWLHSLIPLPAYYFLSIYGNKRGTIIIAWAIGIAAGFTLWAGTLANLSFSLTLLPIGFILARAYREKEPVQHAGIKSVGYLALVWLITGWLIGMATQTNPYHELQQSLDKGFEATFKLYQESGRFPAGDLEEIKTFISQLREQVARLFPALLINSIICTVWLNTLLGQWLLRKKDPSCPDREDLKNWRLPELLVWPVILTGMALLVPDEKLHTIALNAGVVLLVLYLSQGVAIVSSLMQRWSLPPAIRVITYILLFLQIYGMALVAALGLADVWLDFRKQRRENDLDDTSVS